MNLVLAKIIGVMQIVIYSVILNNHQVHIADELWHLTGGQFFFIELENLSGDNKKGSVVDYSKRPYLLKSWESQEAYNRAMELAKMADCCIFSGVSALPFQKERMKLDLLSFDMSERWLKRGIINIFSPTIFKMFLAYHRGGWNKKQIYKLCCGAFVASDQRRLGTYRGKCYKWGYFINAEEKIIKASLMVPTSKVISLMWCSRYLTLKHPELPILMARRLKDAGYQFMLDMYGEGDLKMEAIELVRTLKIDDVVCFHNNIPNSDLLQEMKKHEIFLFTSDRNEGWGVVANESMANGCALIASDAIGSVPYLVKDKYNGLICRSSKVSCSFKNPDMDAVDSLYQNVEWLLQHVKERRMIQQNAIKTMCNLWSPQNAALALLELIKNINNKDFTIKEGPCSMA